MGLRAVPVNPFGFDDPNVIEEIAGNFVPGGPEKS
jgi:hypothetical protein